MSEAQEKRCESLPENPSGEEGGDPLARFRSWHGFLVAALAVNSLFVYTMLGHAAGPGGVWAKSLVWLPFNAIATAVYLAIMSRLGGAFYRLLCGVLIVGNWAAMFGS